MLVLGAGPAYTDRAGSASSAYLVSSGEDAVSLDLGQGSFTNLVRAIAPLRLSAIVVSHLHPDHFIDLVPLRHYLRYELRPSGRVRVLAPAGLEERLDALLGEPGFSAAALDIERLAPGERRIGGLSVETALVTHTPESYGMRISTGSGAALVYSGDCGRADDLLPLIRPGDVLLCEIAFGVGPVPPGAQHLDAQAVGALAAKGHVGRLLLTHLQMGFEPGAALEAVSRLYDGPAQFVLEGDRIRI